MVRIGILGYGNIGKGTEIAVAQADDMELVAVFEKKSSKRQDYDRGCSRCKRERNRKLER